MNPHLKSDCSMIFFRIKIVFLELCNYRKSITTIHKVNNAFAIAQNANQYRTSFPKTISPGKSVLSNKSGNFTKTNSLQFTKNPDFFKLIKK